MAVSGIGLEWFGTDDDLVFSNFRSVGRRSPKETGPFDFSNGPAGCGWRD